MRNIAPSKHLPVNAVQAPGWSQAVQTPCGYLWDSWGQCPLVASPWEWELCPRCGGSGSKLHFGLSLSPSASSGLWLTKGLLKLTCWSHGSLFQTLQGVFSVSSTSAGLRGAANLSCNEIWPVFKVLSLFLWLKIRALSLSSLGEAWALYPTHRSVPWAVQALIKSVISLKIDFL